MNKTITVLLSFIFVFSTTLLASDYKINKKYTPPLVKSQYAINKINQLEIPEYLYAKYAHRDNLTKSAQRIMRTTENATHVLVDSSRNGYGWLNEAIHSVDYYPEADFVLLGYRKYQTGDTRTGILGAAEIDVSGGLEGGELFVYGDLNADIAQGTVGARYPGVVALDMPFIHFNQYMSGNADTEPAISSPYLISDYLWDYGNNGGDWTGSLKMDEGYTHHDSPGGNRLWNGPVSIVKDANNVYHYVGVYANWFLASEAARTDDAILTATAEDPTDAWTINTNPVLIDPTKVTMPAPHVSMNSSGFGVIAATGHDGEHPAGEGFAYAELRPMLMITNDYGVTWSDPIILEWDDLGIPTVVVQQDSIIADIDSVSGDTIWYEGPAFVGTNFDMDVLVDEDNNIYIAYMQMWGVSSEDLTGDVGGWYPMYHHTGLHLILSEDKGATFSNHRIMYNNGFFAGDSSGPIYLDSEVDLGMDADGNLYAAWLDRPRFDLNYSDIGKYFTIDNPEVMTDVFVSGSKDKGKTWGWRVNVTNTPDLDEYELKMANTVSTKNGGTVYIGYNLVDVDDPFVGDEDIYMARVNRIWIGEVSGVPTAIDNEPLPTVAKEFSLKQNYPNPFNPATVIEFNAHQSGRAQITVYNTAGQMVGRIFERQVTAGQNYKIRFEANGLSAGVYFYQLSLAGKKEIKKMVYLK
ncbi:MAG TPA: T9SS type A sorting domain-containing protein [Caldithrix abyssi]|uniref:T9SS type A sorting domain-containing protein n=1 Tax=Caldithrix abyssi TaxID=187145 RepID=A0A7V4U014_CALAY|nr:T9SS type A sorting domain-containing protein [Caldithrix abyssi]